MQQIIEETGLIKATTIASMVGAWRLAEQQITEGHRLLLEAQSGLQSAFDSSSNRLYLERDNLLRDTPDDIIKDLKRKAWETIIDKTNIRKVMSEVKQKEMDDQIKKGDFPDITEQNVLAVLETNYGRMAEYAEGMIREVYEWLRPGGYYRTEYKTNIKSEAAGVGSKIIKGWTIERGYGREKPWRVRYQSADNLTALDNVFHLLDGKGVVKSHHGPFYDAVSNCGPEGVCQTEYFRGKMFHNGNLHLEFLRLDLLQEFNRVAGGARLRESYGKPPATA